MELILEDIVYRGKSGDLYMDVEPIFNEDDVYSGFRLLHSEFVTHKGSIMRPIPYLIEGDRKIQQEVLDQYNREN